MTQRQFNKEVRDQFEMMWKVLHPNSYCPWIQFHVDKRTNGKRRRIFKTLVLSAIGTENFLKIWQIIANQCPGWEVVSGVSERGYVSNGIVYVGMKQTA